MRHGLVDYTSLSSPVDMNNLENIMVAYRVCARAEVKSPKTIRSTTQAVSYFADYLGGAVDVTSVTASDLRGFIVALREKKRWSNHPTNRSDKPLSPFSIASYVRSIKAFWTWLEGEVYIKEFPFRKVEWLYDSLNQNRGLIQKLLQE